MAHIVTSDQKNKISNRLAEINRQVFLQPRYGHDPDLLISHLQAATEGKFVYDSKSSFGSPAIVIPSLPPFEFPRLFKADKTNLSEALASAECFTHKVLRHKDVSLRTQFDIPTEFPWKSLLFVFDPGFNNGQAVELSLQGQNLKVYEQNNVMEYTGSEASARPTLHVIENSIRPTQDTMWRSPDQFVADGRPYLELRGYALAFGQRYSNSKDYLDSETWTWFPKNRLPYGAVASGYWHPRLFRRMVGFRCFGPSHSYGDAGARLAMPVPLKA